MKITISLILTTLFSFHSLAAGSFVCRNMSDEKLLELLSDVESRLACKSSLSMGAICSGVGGTSAFAATALANAVKQKLANKVIQAELLSISNMATEIEALKYQQVKIVNTGDLSQATNSSGDAEIKKKIPEIEKKISESFKKIEKLKQTPAQIALALNAMTKKALGEEQSKFILKTLEKLRDVAEYNPRGAGEIHILAQKLFNPLKTVISSAAQATGIAGGRLAIAGGAALRSSAQAGKKIFGSRFVAFLGGAAFTGVTLGLYTPSIACQSDLSLQYLTYDEDCKPQVEISENVINFLTASVPDQLLALKSDQRVCDFYFNLAEKIRLQDQPAESTLAQIRNLSCGNTISFETDNGKRVSSYQILAKDGLTKALKGENPDLRLGFSGDGAVSQYCEGSSSCESFQSGASRKVAEKVISTVSSLRLAVSEASACCESTGDVRTVCLNKYGAPSKASSEKQQKSSGVRSSK